jgi:molybdenum cofactor biosynthesis enzyme MoaA
MGKKEFREADHNGPMVSWLINHRCNFTCNYCFLSESFLSKEHQKKEAVIT